MALTERQLEAAAVQDVASDTCVVAGPGSGKTTVLVEYFERLVAAGRDPLRILTITFTDKAANNMREKLARAFQHRPEIRARLERAYVSTVHAFCARLLKENAVFAGIDPEFYVMDERESARAQRESVDETLDSMFAEEPERMRKLMRSLSTTDAGAMLIDVYDAVRASGIRIGDLPNYRGPDGAPIDRVLGALRRFERLRPADWTIKQLEYLEEAREQARTIRDAAQAGPGALLRAVSDFECNLNRLKKNNPIYEAAREARQLLPTLEYALITEYYAGERRTIFDVLDRFDALYHERKRQAGGLDYDDLEEYAVRLLEENPEVRGRVQGQFDQVLMDEFQDTNGRQAKLLDYLRAPNRFYAVGDINQSIYGFRHAEPDVFREYRARVAAGGGRLVELVENFRSRADILHTVEAVVRGAPGIEARPLEPGLSFPAKAEPSVEVLAGHSEEIEAAAGIEACAVAARILELEGKLPLRQKIAEFRDFAVLVRNSEVLAEFTRAFDEWGIPYLVNRGKGFYETREVVDLMHMLRVLVNPRDEISMAAVLRSPFVRASEEALFRLKRLGNLGEVLQGSTAETFAAFRPEDADRLGAFRDRLKRWRESRDYTPMDEMLLHAIDECGYECPSGPRGAANIEKFVGQARIAGTRQSLAEFAGEIEQLRASRPREPDAPPEDSANAVKVMTVHSAKGLEFPIVFLAALHKGIESGPGGISFLPRVGLGARWKHPFRMGKDKDDSFQHTIREALKKREEEEGNRLFYVAMTRAEEHLVLSLAANGKRPQNWAALLRESVGLDWDTPGDGVATITAPGGQRVRIRVQCLTAAPAGSGRVERSEARERVVELDRPVPAEQYDSHANVTSIALFTDCPRRYFLSRYLGFEGRLEAPAEGQSEPHPEASEFGRQVHALLAGEKVDSPDPEAVKLAELFRASALGRRAAKAATVEREFDFLMEIENLVLRGQIDLWFEENGGAVLVDYKTDRIPATEAAVRAERYALQVRLYALALERLTGRAPREAWIYFLRPDLAVPIDLRSSLFDNPELAVREFREAQETGSFPLKEGAHCRTCPHFRGLCPAGGRQGWAM